MTDPFWTGLQLGLGFAAAVAVIVSAGAISYAVFVVLIATVRTLRRTRKAG